MGCCYQKNNWLRKHFRVLQHLRNVRQREVWLGQGSGSQEDREKSCHQGHDEETNESRRL